MHSVAMQRPERVKALLSDTVDETIARRAQVLVGLCDGCVVNACTRCLRSRDDLDQQTVREHLAMHKYLYTEVASPTERQQIDAGSAHGGIHG